MFESRVAVSVPPAALPWSKQAPTPLDFMSRMRLVKSDLVDFEHLEGLVPRLVRGPHFDRQKALSRGSAGGVYIAVPLCARRPKLPHERTDLTSRWRKACAFDTLWLLGSSRLRTAKRSDPIPTFCPTRYLLVVINCKSLNSKCSRRWYDEPSTRPWTGCQLAGAS